MKKILICFLQVALVFAVVSCEKGLEDESSFITPGEGGVIPENPLWDWSDTYPGPVNAALQTMDTVVTIIGQYKALPYAPETPILQSTGLYTGIDNTVNVNVPASAIGLKYQIGLAHKLAPDQAQRRYPNVVKKGDLVPGRINQISSNFGGYIYFYYEPADVMSAPAEVRLNISGAYQSLDYFKGSDAETQRYYVRVMKERSQQLQNTALGDDELVFLNWTELRSPKVILTFGVKDMNYLSNPDRLLQQYENMADAFLDFGGYGKPEDYELPVFRVYADIQLPNTKQKIVANSDGSVNNSQDERKFGGYPIGVLKHPNVRGTSFTDEWRYMNSDDQLAFGYNNRADTKFAATQYGFGIAVLGEWAKAAWMKYPALRLANHYYCQQISNGTFWGSPGYTTKAADWNLFLKNNWLRSPYVNIDTKKQAWFKNSFDTNGNPVIGTNGNQLGKPIPADENQAASNEGCRTLVYLQLVQKYGWGIIKYINQRSAEVGFVNEYEQDAHDFFVMAACEYADADLRPFFRWWLFPYTAYAVQFIRDQGFPQLERTLPFDVNGITYNYAFYDWPAAGQTWFPNNKAMVNEDKWPAGTTPTRKAAVWPEKPYYNEIANTGWTAYGEIIESVPSAKEGSTFVYDPNFMRTNQSDAVILAKGFNASTYIWFRSDNNGSPGGGNRLKSRMICDNSWFGGDQNGSVGGMKGGTGMGNQTNPDRGNDTSINWGIIDIDFKKPVKFNAIRTGQQGRYTESSNIMQSIVYIQYYVEPGYTQPADPSDPTSEDVWVESGSINGVYDYDPDNDPRRAIWKGYNHADNTVPYPGRTKNMNDNGPEVNFGDTNGGTKLKQGNWGFHPGGSGYFALVTPRPVLKEHRKQNNPIVRMEDQNWYEGVMYIIRDGGNREYVYFLEETIETRRLRFFLRPDIQDRLGDPMGYNNENSWRMRPLEFGVGLVSTEVPAPGKLPAPQSYFKGTESGDYPNVGARNYGGSPGGVGW